MIHNYSLGITKNREILTKAVTGSDPRTRQMAGAVSHDPDGARRNTCKTPDCKPTQTYHIGGSVVLLALKFATPSV